MKKGAFCISLDLELLWGRKHADYAPFIKRVRKERKVIKRLLELFDKYGIAATWAVVGKLFEDPDKNKDQDLWSGKDIIKTIQDHKNQEIASHSYSHIFFREITRSEADKDLKNCWQVAEKNKIKFYSFVFPKNAIAYLDLLKKYGFIAYRGADHRDRELLVPASPPVYEPQLSNGLVNIPGSMYYVSARGLRKHIPTKLRVAKAKMGIAKAIKEKKIFHLWFHPVDLVDGEDKMFEGLEKIFSYADEKRRKGSLEIKTMREIAEEVLS